MDMQPLIFNQNSLSGPSRNIHCQISYQKVPLKANGWRKWTILQKIKKFSSQLSCSRVLNEQHRLLLILLGISCKLCTGLSFSSISDDTPKQAAFWFI